MPRALHITTYEIPENEFITFDQKHLPGDWRAAPAPQSTKDFGSALLKDPNVIGLKIPSTIVPDEFNYLINPASTKLHLIKY
jgi:RES domain-containing protein